MASLFVNVTAEDMAAFLEPQGFSRIQPPKCVELVWRKIVTTPDGHEISLRVFSGINPDGQSRSSGKDAIRVMLFIRTDDYKDVIPVGGSKMVKRMANWRKYLGERINKWEESIGPKCECGRFMSLREPGPKQTWKPFYGCTGWKKDGTGCSKTKQV